VHCILLMYPTILNEFFVQRTKAWFRIVIQEGLGFKHYWYRFEFAKSRGAIHFHSLLLDSEKSSRLHGSLDALRELFATVLQKPVGFHIPKPSVSSMDDPEQELVHLLTNALPEVFAPVSALHPSGRTMQSLPGHPYPPTNADGEYNLSTWAKNRLAAAGAPGFEPLNAQAISKLVEGTDVPHNQIGNLFLWPPHEGLGPQPNKLSLRKWPFEVSADDELADYIDFANTAALHGCSSYCLNKEGKCRMGFGDENKAVASRCDGKPAAAVPYLHVEHGVSKFNAPRDHPRFVQGCIELGRAFGANTDWQVFPCYFGIHIFLSSLTDLPSPLIFTHRLLSQCSAISKAYQNTASTSTAL